MNLKKLTRYSYIVAFVVTAFIAISVVVAWYTQTSTEGWVFLEVSAGVPFSLW